MSDAYIPGEVARISAHVADITGVAADPGGVRLLVKAGNAVAVAYIYGVDAIIVRDSVGEYHADLPITSAGRWAYRWELTAPNAGAAEGTLSVDRSLVV